MGTHHGKDGVVKAGSDSVGEVKAFTLTETIETVDDSAMGDTSKTHLTGMKGWSGSVTAHWDLDDTGQGALDNGASVTLALYPEGAGTGAKYKTGTATITEVTHRAEMNGVVEISFNYLGNGALTESTAA
jgi:hypothetical protein